MNEDLKRRIIESTDKAAEYIAQEKYQAAVTALSGAYAIALSLPVGVISTEIYHALQDTKELAEKQKRKGTNLDAPEKIKKIEELFKNREYEKVHDMMRELAEAHSMDELDGALGEMNKEEDKE